MPCNQTNPCHRRDAQHPARQLREPEKRVLRRAGSSPTSPLTCSISTTRWCRRWSRWGCRVWRRLRPSYTRPRDPPCGQIGPRSKPRGRVQEQGYHQLSGLVSGWLNLLQQRVGSCRERAAVRRLSRGSWSHQLHGLPPEAGGACGMDLAPPARPLLKAAHGVRAAKEVGAVQAALGGGDIGGDSHASLHGLLGLDPAGAINGVTAGRRGHAT